MLKSVTNWLAYGGTEEEKEAADVTEKIVVGQPMSTKDGEQETRETEAGDEHISKGAEEDPEPLDFDEIRQKAITTAKQWGSYLYQFGVTATNQVAETARHLKDTVSDKTIIGDFGREQDKFVSEIKEKNKASNAAVPPWVGYNEEEQMKQQILALSEDKRNFLRNPPAGVQFYFDFDASHPVAMAMLQEDPNLEKMRFELVPKQINEHTFWRNYFYRVSLIKQSAQLSSIAQQTGNSRVTDSTRTNDAKREKSPGSRTLEAVTPTSPPADSEFISDAFQHDSASISKDEMHQIGVDDKIKMDDMADWEKELQAELQDYEVVEDTADDCDLEKEILREIEDDTKNQ